MGNSSARPPSPIAPVAILECKVARNKKARPKPCRAIDRDKRPEAVPSSHDAITFSKETPLQGRAAIIVVMGVGAKCLTRRNGPYRPPAADPVAIPAQAGIAVDQLTRASRIARGCSDRAPWVNVVLQMVAVIGPWPPNSNKLVAESARSPARAACGPSFLPLTNDEAVRRSCVSGQALPFGRQSCRTVRIGVAVVASDDVIG